MRELISQRVDTNSGMLMFNYIDQVNANGVELEGALALSQGLRVTLRQAFQDV